MKQDKPLIIPIFIPHKGCRNQCAFCNQNSITGINKEPLSQDQLDDVISTYLTYRGTRKSVQISFYGGTFLGLKNEEIQFFLNCAESYIQKGDVDSIRFSTRPDSITPEKLDLIRSFSVKTIEIGAQSLNDQVLKTSLRGNTSQDIKHAVNQLKERGYETGVQLMTGLPGDTDESCLETCRQVIHLKPDFVRIYPTLVIQGSPLADWYRSGAYTPHSLKQSVTLVKNMLLLFKQSGISVIRMGLQAEKDLDSEAVVLDGPYHPAFGHLVFSEVAYDDVHEYIKEHLADENTHTKTLELTVNSRSHSRFRGQNNENITKLKSDFGFQSIRLKTDNELEFEEFRVGLVKE